LVHRRLAGPAYNGGLAGNWSVLHSNRTSAQAHNYSSHGSSHIFVAIIFVLFVIGILNNAFGPTGTWAIIAAGVALYLFFKARQSYDERIKQQSQNAATDWMNEQIDAGKQFKLICGEPPSTALENGEMLLGSFSETN
jgi:hypothetical protein